MEFIKNIARKILSDEIEELKEKAERFEKRIIGLRKETTALECKLSDKQTEISKINSEKALAEQRAKEIEKENEILRKYYDLDKEPSDEIKTKIHIDLEINRLKKEKDDLKNEILKILSMRNQPIYTQSYYGYPFYGRRF